MKVNRLVVITAFLFGYAVSDVVNNVSNSFISKVSAEVDGMNYHELGYDYDFKKAVQDLIEQSHEDYSFKSAVSKTVESNCLINVSGGYVMDGYIYGINSYISC